MTELLRVRIIKIACSHEASPIVLENHHGVEKPKTGR